MEPREVDDVCFGGYLERGQDRRQHRRPDRAAAEAAAERPGMTVEPLLQHRAADGRDRRQQVLLGHSRVAVAGGLESISLVGTSTSTPTWRTTLGWSTHKPEIYMAMIETAEIVAERYGVSREAQDEYALQSPAADRRRAGARALRRGDRADGHQDGAGRQGDQARPRSTTHLDRDECNRPGTTIEGLAS